MDKRKIRTGPRAGAGRPAKAPTVQLSCRVDAAALAACKAKGVMINKMVNGMVKEIAATCMVIVPGRPINISIQVQIKNN